MDYSKTYSIKLTPEQAQIVQQLIESLLNSPSFEEDYLYFCLQSVLYEFSQRLDSMKWKRGKSKTINLRLSEFHGLAFLLNWYIDFNELSVSNSWQYVNIMSMYGDIEKMYLKK